MTVTVTPKAQAKLVELGVGDETFLRLGVKSGGCSGMTYDASLDDALGQGDAVVYEAQPIRVVTAREQMQALDGLDIDYSDDLVKSGFRLSNPNNAHSCGCGASFKQGEGCGNGG
jgi:iron-sulfur cluster assembly protein